MPFLTVTDKPSYRIPRHDGSYWRSIIDPGGIGGKTAGAAPGRAASRRVAQGTPTDLNPNAKLFACQRAPKSVANRI